MKKQFWKNLKNLFTTTEKETDMEEKNETTTGNKMLLLIDCQNDFITGSLAVPGAKDIMDALTRYVEKYGKNYKIITFTMDQHPSDHCSFKENGGEWPAHCVRFSEGAAIYMPLLKAVNETGVRVIFLEKGKDAKKEEYSAFENFINKAGIQHLVTGEDIEQIDVSGIAAEYCVLESVKSLVNQGFSKQINVIEDFCPAIGDGSELHDFVEKNKLKK